MNPHFVVPPGVSTSRYSRQHGSSSVWLMTMTENRRATIALAEGSGLTVYSNNTSVVPDRMGVTTSAGLAVFELYGSTAGTTMIEARRFDGSVATYVQVRVDPLAATGGRATRLIRLKSPHASLNAPNVKPINMSHTKIVPGTWDPWKMTAWVPKDSRHLVFSCHGFHTGRKADFPRAHMAIGNVLHSDHVGAFDTLMAVPNLLTIWLMACSLAGEGPGDAFLSEMARRSGCYVVSASYDTEDKTLPWGHVEDYRHSFPKYFHPDGGGKTVSRGQFFELGPSLGFDLVV